MCVFIIGNHTAFPIPWCISKVELKFQIAFETGLLLTVPDCNVHMGISIKMAQKNKSQ